MRSAVGIFLLPWLILSATLPPTSMVSNLVYKRLSLDFIEQRIARCLKLLCCNLVFFSFLSYSNSLFSSNTSASIKAYGLHAFLDVGSSPLGGSFYFTTYDGRSSWPLNDSNTVSGELKQSSFGSSNFVTDYLAASYNGIYEYGTVTLSMPTADSDSNGVPDWLQKNMSANNNISGSAELHYHSSGASGDYTIKGTIYRSAGLSSGNYNLIYTKSGGSSSTASGVWYIGYYDGIIEYDESIYSVNAKTLNTSGEIVTATGSAEYSFSDSEKLNLGNINLYGLSERIQLQVGTLERNGNTYSGFAKAVDGNPNTSWSDFVDWYIVISDPNDSDGDGIPDFSDTRVPALSILGSEIFSGWRFMDLFGFYFPCSSGWFYHMDHGWIYSNSLSLDSIWIWHEIYDWCWTNQAALPWVWFHKDKKWKYFLEDTSEWIELDANLPKSWFVGNASNLEMIWVDSGSFMMGSPASEYNRDADEILHEVILTQGFYLGKYEVTQDQYEAVMVGNSDGLSPNPSDFSGKPNHPVEKVSWNDTQVFLRRLNKLESSNVPEGWTYALPTEAQWEYACRAGTTSSFSTGLGLAESAAHFGLRWDSDNGTTKVGSYPSNQWGFHDMHGNVNEWCNDLYAPYNVSSKFDPKGADLPDSYSSRVLRGGQWSFVFNKGLRSANRSSYYPSSRFNTQGFRICLRRQ